MLSHEVKPDQVPTLNSMLPAVDQDVTRLIATSLEPVNWAHMANFQIQLAR
jgi:hypothetical protein